MLLLTHSLAMPSSGRSTSVPPVWFVRVLVERFGLVRVPERVRVPDRVRDVGGIDVPERRKKPLRSSEGWNKRTRARGRVKAT